MRERANCHLSIAADINYKEPNDDERRGSSGKNAAMHHELCHSERNRHSYGDNPTKKEALQNELDLIWPQLNPCLWSLLNLPKHPFPLTAFVSVFGAPGFHMATVIIMQSIILESHLK
jgi:hypothetical protein